MKTLIVASVLLSFVTLSSCRPPASAASAAAAAAVAAVATATCTGDSCKPAVTVHEVKKCTGHACKPAPVHEPPKVTCPGPSCPVKAHVLKPPKVEHANKPKPECSEKTCVSTPTEQCKCASVEAKDCKAPFCKPPAKKCLCKPIIKKVPTISHKVEHVKPACHGPHCRPGHVAPAHPVKPVCNGPHCRPVHIVHNARPACHGPACKPAPVRVVGCQGPSCKRVEHARPVIHVAQRPGCQGKACGH